MVPTRLLLLLASLAWMSAAKYVSNEAGLSNDISTSSVSGSSFQDACGLQLYKVKNFQEPAIFITRTKKRVRYYERSLRTIGECCWALFPRKGFKGRPMYLGNHIALSDVGKWGWRSQKIRSVRRLRSCNSL